MRVGATITGAEALIERFTAMPGAVHNALHRAVNTQTINLQAYVKASKLSGQVLNRRSGRLSRSINARLTDSAQVITGSVGTNVEYAHILEYGGTTAAHLIEAKNGKALAFMVGGKTVFAKSVQHPGSKIPAFRFLRGALEDKAPTIRAALREAALAATNGAGA